ncbi:MAG: hypothetical protein AB1468_03095 [Candidatus Micrarchaeota archaeon]
MAGKRKDKAIIYYSLLKTYVALPREPDGIFLTKKSNAVFKKRVRKLVFGDKISFINSLRNAMSLKDFDYYCNKLVYDKKVRNLEKAKKHAVMEFAGCCKRLAKSNHSFIKEFAAIDHKIRHPNFLDGECEKFEK